MSASAAGELAVFGGSFDPPHVGHVLLATWALSVGGVEKVLVVPTFQHAFGKPLSDFDARMTLCERAFAPLPAAEVLPLERELGGVSRTLRLVEALASRYPAHRLRLLVGADILLQSAQWDRFDEITRRAPLLVAGRSGYASIAADAIALPEVSSSAIRRDLAAGVDVSAKLPREVLAYVRAHGMYGASAP